MTVVKLAALAASLGAVGGAGRAGASSGGRWRGRSLAIGLSEALSAMTEQLPGREDADVDLQALSARGAGAPLAETLRGSGP